MVLSIRAIFSSSTTSIERFSASFCSFASLNSSNARISSACVTTASARLGLKPGLKFIVSIKIHMVLVGYGHVFAARGRGQRAAHRGATELLK
jgi:hypothetical protein